MFFESTCEEYYVSCMSNDPRMKSTSNMTVLDVLDQLCGVSHVVDGGASKFHDEFGHIVSAIALTGWPGDERFSAPVVWSTDALVPEQLAELCQRMFIRSALSSVASGIEAAAIHVDGTLGSGPLRRIQSRVFSAVEGEPTINLPDEKGTKLSKLEALAWTYLFAVEDIHIFASRIVANRGQDMDPVRLARFKERVGELMYQYAITPDVSTTTMGIAERKHLMEGCFEMLGLDPDEEMSRIFGHYLSDETLGHWYDSFLPYFDALDSQGLKAVGRPFSQLSINELRALKVSSFLPERDTDGLFAWFREGEEIDVRDKWVGVLRFETARKLWIIVDVSPPRINEQNDVDRSRPGHAAMDASCYNSW